MAQEKFTEEEYNHLKEQMKRVKSELPLDMTSLVWSSYGKIDGGNIGGQPCNCGSSANLWRGAVNTINDYIKLNG
jgi:hypothetical protein